MQSFGIKLKRLRDEKELTQKELGELLGLTRATISSYERCALYPSVEALISICQFFNVTADYMLGLADANTFFSKDGVVRKILCSVCMQY